MIQFANPAFLWGFLGLAVPIAIHLLNRKEGKLIRVGSLRHIRETSTRQFRSIKLNEIALLALRSLIISLIVLLLSGASISMLTGNSKWVLIERGLQNWSGLESMLDSLKEDGYEVRHLEKGFPRSPSANQQSAIDYAGLMEDLGTNNAMTVIVFSQSRAFGFRGRRMALPPNVRWIVVDENTESEFPVSAIQTSKDILTTRMASSSASGTSMKSVKVSLPPNAKFFRSDIDSVLIRSRDTVRVLLAFGDAFARDGSAMVAVLKTLRGSIPDVLEWHEGKPEDVNSQVKADWLIWLSDTPPPQVEANTILFEQGSGETLLIRKSTKRFVITRRLNEENVVRKNLAIDMLHVLFPASEESRVAAGGDKRSIDERLSWSGVGAAGATGAVDNHATVGFILILIFVTLLLERTLSYHRDQ